MLSYEGGLMNRPTFRRCHSPWNSRRQAYHTYVAPFGVSINGVQRVGDSLPPPPIVATSPRFAYTLWLLEGAYENIIRVRTTRPLWQEGGPPILWQGLLVARGEGPPLFCKGRGPRPCNKRVTPASERNLHLAAKKQAPLQGVGGSPTLWQEGRSPS